jgi:hypothetical protein
MMSVREKKQIACKCKPIKISGDFSIETLKAGHATWVLNENNFEPRILYPAKLSFKIDGARKTIRDKQKLK